MNQYSQSTYFSFLLLLFFSLIVFSACSETSPTKFYNGYKLPDLKLPNIQGDSVAISDFKNKIVLVEFWASWCQPCRVKHSDLNKIRDKYKDEKLRGGENGFEIYYVSLDDSEKAWQKAMQKDGIADWTFHVADLIGMKKSTIPEKFNFEKVPTAYLIDGNGVIIGVDISEERLDYELSLRIIENDE